MTARALIIEARRRAGLTQKGLADRMGTHQPVVARWETGKTKPTVATVENVLRACGFHLSVALTPADDHDDALIARELSLDPHERLASMVRAINTFDAMAGARDHG
jgi:transcriptional regulator with XRE-family HTH domain